MPAGRPTKYNPEYNEQVVKLCRLGLTDAELADFFEVSEVTINAWKKEAPEFLKSIKKGKEYSDAQIAQSLYHRAKGYKAISKKQKVLIDGGVIDYEEETEYPPDTTAAIIWLKNRRPKNWRDKIEHEVSGPDNQPIQITIVK